MQLRFLNFRGRFFDLIDGFLKAGVSLARINRLVDIFDGSFDVGKPICFQLIQTLQMVPELAIVRLLLVLVDLRLELSKYSREALVTLVGLLSQLLSVKFSKVGLHFKCS